MLQQQNDSIVEMSYTGMAQTTTGGLVPTSNTIWTSDPYWYYLNYPVYVSTDRTKKAIDILKALEKEKLLKVQSVPRFIELVEKISVLL